jgi:23S rRNA pseudouridine1911/1915/1917 synthase
VATGEIVWVVGEGDGASVEAIVERAGGDERALAEGRVFIGRRRATAGDAARVGDEVRIVAAAPERASSRGAPEVRVLRVEGGLLAVDKPAGIVTIPDTHDASTSLQHVAARLAGLRPDALHATSRLDRQVSGIVIFATTPTAREYLQNARESGRYLRRYVALASAGEGFGRTAAGEWSDPIGRARDPKKRAVGGRDAVPASTRYAIASVLTISRVALLGVEPVTGRTHQIRVHAAHAGAPLLGDRDYGGPRTLVLPSGKVVDLDRIALHCAHVRVDGLALESPVPEVLRGWWEAAGGAADAWTTASSFSP